MCTFVKCPFCVVRYTAGMRRGRRKNRQRGAQAFLYVPALLISFVIAIALNSGGVCAQFEQTMHQWRSAGNSLIGFNVGAPRQNIISLVRDVSREVRVIDHGVLRTSALAGPVNYLSQGSIYSVADALHWFDVPVTSRQARIVAPCRPLSALKADESITVSADPIQSGIASWYGPGFDGRVAASGEVFNMYEVTAAHKTLPMQSWVRVINRRTGKSVVVRINDRGPYIPGRIIDLSYESKQVMGMQDIASVYLERIDPEALSGDCP